MQENIIKGKQSRMVVERLEICKIDKEEGVQNTVLGLNCSDISLNVS